MSGDVKLILRDGKTLTLKKGIRVPEGSSLTIYGQSNDSGKLDARAGSYNAAIGSNDRDDDEEQGAGTIIIHGGDVTAKGGSDSAGIGGGNEAHGGNITVYGGKVTSTAGTDAAGISSGDEYKGGSSGTVTIYGGVVNATGGDCGAGIGGGDDGNGGNVTIIDSKVIATAGKESGARAIGRGNGGKSNGSLTLSDNLMVCTGSAEKQGEEYIFETTGTVKAEARVDACQKNQMILIDLCDHVESEWRCESTAQHGK